jgi:hypothetical protein
VLPSPAPLILILKPKPSARAVLQVLESALDDYKQRHEDTNTDPDEMILSAGDYLVRVLEPVEQQRVMRNYMLMGAAGLSSLLTAGVLLWHLRSRSDGTTTSPGGSSSSAKGSAGSIAAGTNSSGGGPAAANSSGGSLRDGQAGAVPAAAVGRSLWRSQ